jgi:acyl-CoA thioesterase YciA
MDDNRGFVVVGSGVNTPGPKPHRVTPRIVPMSTESSPEAAAVPPDDNPAFHARRISNRSARTKTMLPIDEELVLKVIPMPGDCNANGDIFGGWVMAQVDLAGSVLPARYSQGRIATVAVNEFVFKQPVRVGDILSLFSKVVRIGRTSITVKVEVYAERIHAQGEYIKVTEALLTYVALDENGHPREIPKP